MRQSLPMTVLVATGLTLAGCVDRRINITSEPSGALVFLNDAEVGRTPVELNFTYFGTYDVRLRKEGYEPLVTTAKAKAPPHEWPVIDFLAMLVPVTKRTRIDWHFELEQLDVDEGMLLDRAQGLRERFESGPPPEGDESSDDQSSVEESSSGDEPP